MPVDEVTEASGTIGDELMCALARHVPVEVEVDAADGAARAEALQGA